MLGDLESHFESAWRDTRPAVAGPDIAVDTGIGTAVDIPVDTAAWADTALAGEAWKAERQSMPVNSAV